LGLSCRIQNITRFSKKTKKDVARERPP
jgi:hypothetical protein